MGDMVKSAMSMLTGNGAKKSADAEAQARQQQQVAQVNQQNAVNEGAKSTAEAMGMAGRRRKGNLLLSGRDGKASLA